MKYVPRNTIRMAICLALALVAGVFLAAEAPVSPLSPALPDAPLPQNPTPSTSSSSAQQSDAVQTPQDEREKKRLQREQAQRELHQEEQQHVLGVVPYFNTVYGQTAAPLSPGQKFELAFKNSTNPFVFVTTGLLAAYGQLVNNFPGYGQGAAGYGKRYGAQYADTFDGNMLGNALLPVLFHQDPRYYRMGTGGFRKRFWYSVSTAFRTRSDKGEWQPAYANILGNYAAGGISNLYYPASDRGIGLTFERGTVVTAENTIGAFFTEFAPDIESRFLHKKSKTPPAVTQP